MEVTLAIDPMLFVPDFLRPPLLIGETKDTQSNLRLESTHEDIYADITFLEHVDDVDNRTTGVGEKRAQMHMKSHHGIITSIIVSALLRIQQNIGQIS